MESNQPKSRLPTISESVEIVTMQCSKREQMRQLKFMAETQGRPFAEQVLLKVKAAVAFFMRIVRQSAHIPMTAIENPVCIMSRLYRKPDQIVQPWQFGHGETKATCLWLKGLPPLQPTEIVDGREARIHRMPSSANRAKERSKTYQGIAKAMGEQWGVQ